MHMCEALIAVYEFTNQSVYLERALKIATQLTCKLKLSDGVICEHYSKDWVADPQKNRDIDRLSEEYMYRPYGSQPGHSMKWCKLLLLLIRYSKPQSQQAIDLKKTAENLFDRAIKDGWDVNKGGLYYTFDHETSLPIDTNKYYQDMAEMIVATGLFYVESIGSYKEEYYKQWYDKAWTHSLKYFVDQQRGGWYPMTDKNNNRVDNYQPNQDNMQKIKCHPTKADYHPFAACFEMHRAIQINKVKQAYYQYWDGELGCYDLRHKSQQIS